MPSVDAMLADAPRIHHVLDRAANEYGLAIEGDGDVLAREFHGNLLPDSVHSSGLTCTVRSYSSRDTIGPPDDDGGLAGGLSVDEHLPGANRHGVGQEAIGH